jgi:hypothetical protein
MTLLGRSKALLGLRTGFVLVLLWASSGFCEEQVFRSSYVAYRFEAGEGWRTRSSGDAGATQWDGKMWTLDFSRGAEWLSITPPDRSLLGKVEKIRFRARGTAKGHPVHLFFRTHFMTFHKDVGEFSGSGEQEIVADGPPGPGWQWFGGENDGKIHGPLRLGEIRLEANRVNDSCALEMLSATIEGSCRAEKRCVMTAEARTVDGQICFHCEVRALSEVALEGKLNWRVTDWDGNELEQGQREVNVPPGGEKLVAQIPAPKIPPDLKFVEAEFKLDIPGQEVSPAQACWLAPHEPRGDTTLRPESPFGMGVYLCRYQGAEMERVANLARDAGVKWSREDFTWARIERQKGQFHWDYYDELLACAKRNGITVYAIVAYWPSWTEPYTEKGVNDYVAFLRELVKRYKEEIRQWEIWNEPNIFFWQGPEELYATLLTKSYAAVKEVDPTAEVLGLSTAGIDYGFIERMLAKQTPFDILTIHPYRRTLDDQSFVNDLKKVSDLVKLPDGRRRPVWLTEMGWATHTPHNAIGQDFQPNTLRAQAQLIARTYLCSIVSGVEPRTFWYDFRNDGEDPLYFEHNMGIVYRDLRPKPAYHAYATLTRLLEGKKFDGALDVPQGNFAYRFVPAQKGRGCVIALWNPRSDTEVSLEVQAQKVTLVNTIGETREKETAPSPNSRENRIVRVSLKKGSPAYLVTNEEPTRGAEPATPAYPLKLAANKRYLADQNDVPFLIHGDSPWSLIVGLTKTEAERYLEDRRQKGFNTLMVNLIEHKYKGPKNRDGEEPFTTPGDFSTPNEKYFAHADWVIGKAAEKGIQILLTPCYLGYAGSDEGWYQEVLANGPTKCRNYGRYLGDRYRKFDNIIWLEGGDRSPEGVVEHVREIASGIREADKRHLHTAHWSPEHVALDFYASEGWLDFNSLYTYKLVAARSLKEYDRTPAVPFFLIESHYENEHDSTTQWIQRQAYSSILCGAMGQLMGNRPIWLFDPGWQAAMDGPGSLAMVHLKALFMSRAWYDLVPDQDHTVVIEGYGDINSHDYAAAARTTNGSTVIAYIPTSRKIVVNMSRVAGTQAKAWWFDPRTGKAESLGEFPTSGSREFTPPGDGDWALVLDDASKNPAAPGTIIAAPAFMR